MEEATVEAVRVAEEMAAVMEEVVGVAVRAAVRVAVRVAVRAAAAGATVEGKEAAATAAVRVRAEKVVAMAGEVTEGEMEVAREAVTVAVGTAAEAMEVGVLAMERAAAVKAVEKRRGGSCRSTLLDYRFQHAHCPYGQSSTASEHCPYVVLKANFFLRIPCYAALRVQPTHLHTTESTRPLLTYTSLLVLHTDTVLAQVSHVQPAENQSALRLPQTAMRMVLSQTRDSW
jgi:hypothetical protein